jgi:hypothetical protein
VSGREREREGLLARVRQIRRVGAISDEPAAPPAPPTDAPGADILEALAARLTHLEQQVQGFQDSVHRESSRQIRRISELEARIEPAELSKALSTDARERGL